MAIFGNFGLEVVSVAAADTTLVSNSALPDTERYAVSAMNVHNTTSTTKTISVYESPNLTSASGERVAQIKIPANSSKDIDQVIGQGYENLNIIAVADAIGLNVKTTVILYNAGD